MYDLFMSSTVHNYMYVVVQFYPWFRFYFHWFQPRFDTLPYPKTTGKKI